MAHRATAPLQILLEMGIPKHRCEKALAATGHKGVQLAADWLLAHVNDPLLDVTTPREYILYACPTGEFLDQLRKFWAKSKTLHGWNGAHNFVPHITLVSFFKAPDEDALRLAQALKSVMERQGGPLNKLSLETYASNNWMGFFVAEEDADRLKRIAIEFVEEVGNSTISLDPQVKSLHLTLAYQFPAQSFANLKQMVEDLDASLSSGWELCLYSRDPRLNGKQVHKVIYPSTAAKCDELELRAGDFIYINSEELATSKDGWVEGTSWLTGCSGLLPSSYTERTAESDAWTLQTKISTSEEGHTNSEVSKESPEEDTKPRKIFLMRHGERIDFTFGKWIPYSFDEEGNYNRKDMNMPKNLPKRKNVPQSFFRDSPLSNVGVFQATLAGESLKEANVQIHHVYCSPALRSVQSCDGALKGLGIQKKTKIKLEPSLFEYMEWYLEGNLEFMSPEEYSEAGFNIDTSYVPLLTYEQLLGLKGKENVEDFYTRNFNVAKFADSAHKTGNILFVGHSCTLEVATRQLLGLQPRNLNDLIRVVSKIPYCAIGCVQKSLGGPWEMLEPPVLGITHTNNSMFDWHLITE